MMSKKQTSQSKGVSFHTTRRCRACLRIGSSATDFVDLLDPLAASGIQCANLLQCFNKCTQLKITPNQLQIRECQIGKWMTCRHLCMNCCDALKQAHNFINTARLSNTLLDEQLGAEHVEFSEESKLMPEEALGHLERFNVLILGSVVPDIDADNKSAANEDLDRKLEECKRATSNECAKQKLTPSEIVDTLKDFDGAVVNVACGFSNNSVTSESEDNCTHFKKEEYAEMLDSSQNSADTECAEFIDLPVDKGEDLSLTVNDKDDISLVETVPSKDNTDHVQFLEIEAENSDGVTRFSVQMESVDEDEDLYVTENGTEDISLVGETELCEDNNDQVQFIEIENGSGDDVTRFSVQIDAIDSESGESNDRRPIFEFHCELCTATFRYQRELLEHREQSHDDTNFPFGCTVCKKRFSTKRSCKIHVHQMHNFLKYVDCQHCGRFVLKSFHKRHVQRHKQIVKFQCNQCPQTFTTKFTLQKHAKLLHTDRDRNVKCEECGRKFFSIKSLQAHKTTHQDLEERATYSCTLCNKTFMRHMNLQLHMQMHRGETINCSYCGKEYVRRKDLEVHIRFHTRDFPYGCSMCDKRFAIKSHLTYHERKHSGFRYKCDRCSKQFINMASLKQHTYEHTGMPMQCNICMRGFPSKFKMRRHVRVVHSAFFETTGYSDALAEEYITHYEMPKNSEMRSKALVDQGNYAVECLEELNDVVLPH